MKKKVPYKVGKWLPSDQKFFDDWMKSVIERCEKEEENHLYPPVHALKELIEGDRELFRLFQLMFDEVPEKYKETPDKHPQVRDYHHMLKLINHIIHRPPEFNTTGLVGCPINAVLDWPMATKAGYVAFMNHRVNDKIRDILNYWGKYLMSADSAKILNTKSNGWLNPLALESMCKAAYGSNFLDIFKTRSNDINNHYGFTSWDDFFTREFKEGIRPVEAPDNDDVIANACESAPYRIARDLPLRAKYWMKGQPYSIQDLLHNDLLTQEFVGGTLYQAFLSALSYHRWHSPVSGTIVKAYNVYGTYYSEDLYEGFWDNEQVDPAAPDTSQAYITEVASRAIIFIKADNPKIGLMAFVAVGMAEVSSNEITVKIGQHVNKGDQLGMFHFGGSTHCLLFRPGVNVEFDLRGQTPGLDTHNIKINERIAVVK